MFKLIKTFSFINILIIVGLLFIHFILREINYFSSIFYYSFPLPVIIIIVLIFSIFLKKKIRIYNLLLMAILLIIWLSRSFKINLAEDINETDIEIVFWNASHDKDFEVAFNVNNGVPDIFVLVEDGEYKVEDFKLKYPKYYFHQSIRGISVFSKKAINILKEITSKQKSNCIEFETHNINFYVVDVSASINVSREQELTFVNDLIKETQNTIVLGDFNLPFESKFFNNIKNNFNHAFNEKGNGFRETWFWNIPLLTLDHIWVSKDLKILKTEKIGTFKSDHCMLKTVLRN